MRTLSTLNFIAISYSLANETPVNRLNPSSKPSAPASWPLSTVSDRSCKPSSPVLSRCSTSSSRASHAVAEGEDAVPAGVMSSPSLPAPPCLRQAGVKRGVGTCILYQEGEETDWGTESRGCCRLEGATEAGNSAGR